MKNNYIKNYIIIYNIFQNLIFGKTHTKQKIKLSVKKKIKPLYTYSSNNAKEIGVCSDKFKIAPIHNHKVRMTHPRSK